MDKLKVYICQGCEIGQKIDIEKLKNNFKSHPQVESIEALSQLCDGAAQEHLKNIKGALLFAACDERTHGSIFKSLAGNNPYELVNVRERCAWVHSEGATEKAVRLLSMGIAELSTKKQLPESRLDLLERVLVLGTGPAGLATAHALAEKGIDVVMLDSESRLGGTLRRTRTVWPSGEDSEALLHRLYNDLEDKLHVTVYQEVELSGIRESKLGYHATLSNGQEEEVGAVVVATGMREVGGNLFDFEYRWRDRGKFRGPLAFEVRKGVHPFLLETALWDAVMLRQEKPEERIVFFVPSDLELPKGFQENAEKYNIEIDNRGGDLKGWQGAHVKLGKLVGNLPSVLAQLLRIPQDSEGYLAQRRYRIRPKDFLSPGIFVVGAAHSPMPIEENINQAFVVAARIKRLFDSKPVRQPAAEIDTNRCIGCGYCAAVCPYGAPVLERTDTGSKASISPRFCTLCGQCIAGCPVFAIADPIKSRETIQTQIESWGPVTHPETQPVTHQPSPLIPLLKKAEGNPQILGFTCDWAGFALDFAGMQKMEYPSSVTFINLRCSARFDIADGVEAFAQGADGIFFALCPLGDCHYESGNHHAIARINHLADLMTFAGFKPERIGFYHADTTLAYGLKSAIEKFEGKLKEFGNLSSDVSMKPELTVRIAAMRRTAQSQAVRWLLSKELELVRKGNVFDERLDAFAYDRLVKETLRTEYQKGLVLEALSEPRSAVEVSSLTGLEARRVFELIVELERETRARFDRIEHERPLYVEVANA